MDTHGPTWNTAPRNWRIHVIFKFHTEHLLKKEHLR